MSTASTTTNQEVRSAEHAGSMQLVSFHLSDEVYGIEIVKVREIILMGEITRVPQTPPFVKGLINLRSTVIPVIDLRIRFDLRASDFTSESRIMVIDVGGKTIGIIVDAVSEVLRVSNDQIAPPPPTVAALEQEYLTGLVKLDDQLLMLLDVDKILGKEDSEAIDSMTASA